MVNPDGSSHCRKVFSVWATEQFRVSLWPSSTVMVSWWLVRKASCKGNQASKLQTRHHMLCCAAVTLCQLPLDSEINRAEWFLLKGGGSGSVTSYVSPSPSPLEAPSQLAAPKIPPSGTLRGPHVTPRLWSGVWVMCWWHRSFYHTWVVLEPLKGRCSWNGMN